MAIELAAANEKRTEVIKVCKMKADHADTFSDLRCNQDPRKHLKDA